MPKRKSELRTTRKSKKSKLQKEEVREEEEDDPQLKVQNVSEASLVELSNHLA